MAPDPRDDGASVAEIQRQFMAMIAGLGAAELGGVARRLMSVGSMAELAAAAAPPERRRPRRDTPVTYRLRIDLADAKPPIWRRVELTSDMFLDEVHQVIQEVFGWEDYHLHRFSSGGSPWNRHAQLYLCPYDVEDGDEGDGGIAEELVRVDEVLVDEGDRLHYVYDYGDDWLHVIRLEAVLDRPVDAPRAVCTEGRRAGPPEDCGGIWGYVELLGTGEVLEPAAFDVAEANSRLHTVAAHAAVLRDAPPTLAALLQGIRGHPQESALVELLESAELDRPAEVTAEEAARAVRRYAWLLDRVGDDGIRLTSAGYLPPVDVAAAVAELGIAGWIGKGNREVQTLPVLVLRESAQKIGLLRKRRGHLSLTVAGRRLRHDPDALWHHLVERFPLAQGQSAERQAGLVTLLCVAAGRAASGESYRILVNGVLTALGWHYADGSALPEHAGSAAASDVVDALDRAGAFGEGEAFFRPAEPTPAGAALARAVLQRQG